MSSRHPSPLATSETLIRELEEKTLQLERANLALQEDICKRERAEAALVAVQRQQRLILESVGEGVHGLDADGRIIFENPAGLSMFGWAGSEMIGQQAHTWIHHHKADGSVYPIEACPIFATLRDGQVRRVDDEVFFRRDGSSFPVEYVASPIRDESAAIIGAVVSFRDVSEQRAAREQLEATAALMRMAGTAARLGGWTLALPEMKLTWSDENSFIHDLPRGYQPTFEEALGYYPPDSREEVRRKTEACARDGTPYEFELQKRTATGRLIWVRSIGEPVRDSEGRIIGLQGAFQDISDRKLAERALQESASELRALAESMPQMVWMAAATGENQYLNQRWVDFTGISLQESLGYGWLKAFHPDDRQRTKEVWERALAGVEDFSAEARVRSAEGAYRWMLVRGLPFRDQSGQIVKWMGTCTDIHDLKVANTKLREQASLLDLAQDAIVVRDLDHHVLYWNQSAERLYGWTAAEAVGTSVLDLIYGESTAFLRAVEIVELRGEWVGEIEQTTRSGKKITVESHWTLVRDEEGQPRSILAINTDITSRKQLEEQFLRAQRLESLGTLAGGIAHDFNNLLAPIVMGVSFLKRFETRENVLAVISNIERSANRGKELVRQVVSFARGVEGSRVSLDVGHIVREVESIVASTFPKNIAFDRRIEEDLWLVDGDPTQLNQVLLNLCVNARDAMPEGGRLLIAVSNLVIDEQYAVMHRGVTPGRYLALEVTDEGTGIPREVRDRMFEPFYTTKDFGKGTGLGLSTVLGIVKGHGGFIDVDTEVGRCTTFTVYLPAQTEAAVEEPLVAELEALPRGGGEIILVVDDEVSILEITTQTLEAYGYRTMTAEDGARAIAIYADHRDEIALVITDMMMPVMNGPALIAALLRINPDVVIVAASGFDAELQDKRDGVKAFLKKPYSGDRLLVLIRSLLSESAD